MHALYTACYDNIMWYDKGVTVPSMSMFTLSVPSIVYSHQFISLSIKQIFIVVSSHCESLSLSCVKKARNY